MSRKRRWNRRTPYGNWPKMKERKFRRKHRRVRAYWARRFEAVLSIPPRVTEEHALDMIRMQQAAVRAEAQLREMVRASAAKIREWNALESED